MSIKKVSFQNEFQLCRSVFLCITLVLITLIFNQEVLSQIKTSAIIQSSNSISFLFSINDPVSIKDSAGAKYIYLPNGLNESKPGSPALPSKVVYVAIPPNSKISVSLKNQEYSIYNNVNISVNPEVVKINDSTLGYVNQSLQREYFQTDQYPSVESNILGYAWIRGYYCAVIRINSSTYNWKLKQVKQLIGGNLNVEYSQPIAYRVNNSLVGPYESVLSKIILNYNTAKNFRSFSNLSANQDSTGGWINYSNDYVKLLIPNDGIYKIGYQDLLNYGLTPSAIDPSTIKIYCKGNQLPLYISASQPGVFSPNDFIEFWATRNYGSPNYRNIVPTGVDYLNYMDRYTDTTFVWITWGNDSGYRVKINNSTNLPDIDTLTSYLNLTHFENDVRLWYYDSIIPRVQLPYWQENKVWTWQVLGTGSISPLTFNASNIVPNSIVKTYVRLISNGADIQVNAHKIGVGLNTSSPQDNITFNYKQTVNFNSTFPSKT